MTNRNAGVILKMQSGRDKIKNTKKCLNPLIYKRGSHDGISKMTSSSMSLAEGKEHHVRYEKRTNPKEKGLIPMADEPNSFSSNTVVGNISRF